MVEMTTTHRRPKSRTRLRQDVGGRLKSEGARVSQSDAPMTKDAPKVTPPLVFLFETGFAASRISPCSSIKPIPSYQIDTMAVSIHQAAN